MPGPERVPSADLNRALDRKQTMRRTSVLHAHHREPRPGGRTLVMAIWIPGCTTETFSRHAGGCARHGRQPAVCGQGCLSCQPRAVHPSGSRRPRLLAGEPEHRICQPTLEAAIVHELFEDLVVVIHHGGHHPQQCPVVLDSGVLHVGILPAIPEGGVGGHARGDRLGDQLCDAGRQADFVQ